MPLTREWRTLNLRHLKVASPRIRRRQRKTVDRKPPVSSRLPIELRIKWWNIVPGDQVRVLGNESDGVRDVLAVDKLTNTVYLRYGKQPDLSVNEMQNATPVHYSKCQLLVGQYQLPASAEAHETPLVKSVFFRWRITVPYNFQCLCKAYLNISPSLGENALGVVQICGGNRPPPPVGVILQKRPEIPWPEEPIPQAPIPKPVSVYDTCEEEVTKLSWTPPTDLVHPGREKTKEWANLYLNALADPFRVRLNFPAELCIADELANPHSRRIRQKRWQEAIEGRERDRHRIRMSTLRDRLPRVSVKEAIAEADWKFKQLVFNQHKEKRRKRWLQSGGQLRMQARQRKKARKARALVRRLNEWQVGGRAGPQFIPPPEPPATQSALQV